MSVYLRHFILLYFKCLFVVKYGIVQRMCGVVGGGDDVSLTLTHQEGKETKYFIK